MPAVHVATPQHLFDLPNLWDMRVKKLAHETITISQTNQTPFERFKAALAQVVAVPKSILPKPSKKSSKK